MSRTRFRCSWRFLINMSCKLWSSSFKMTDSDKYVQFVILLSPTFLLSNICVYMILTQIYFSSFSLLFSSPFPFLHHYYYQQTRPTAFVSWACEFKDKWNWLKKTKYLDKNITEWLSKKSVLYSHDIAKHRKVISFVVEIFQHLHKKWYCNFGSPFL